MLTKLELDHEGFGELATTQAELAAEIHRYAEQIAEHVTGETGYETVVDDYITDRVASAVTITDPRGAEAQASGGVLTRAAASVGLEVKEK